MLDRPLLDKAADAGVVLDSVPFIQVVDITDEDDNLERIERLYRKPVTVVFTSVNAVRAVCEQVYFSKQGWTIYCIGHATRNAVLEYFDREQVHGIANDAAALAGVIKNNGVSEVVFFCGDRRMDTLGEQLEKYGVQVNEIIVYRTEEVPRFVEKDYDGILFFSPSGVNSFFSMNTIEPSAVLFAIGSTTARALKENAEENKVITCELPSKEQMVDTAIQYFNKGR